MTYASAVGKARFLYVFCSQKLTHYVLNIFYVQGWKRDDHFLTPQDPDYKSELNTHVFKAHYPEILRMTIWDDPTPEIIVTIIPFKK